MTSAELSSARSGAVARGVDPLAAQRLLDLTTLTIAPSVAGALVALARTGDPGGAIVVLGCLAFATNATGQVNLPLHLMPICRALLAPAGPVAGVAAAWLITLATGTPYAVGAYDTVVFASWIVLALGAWLRAVLAADLTARVAVIGDRRFAADFSTELAATGVTRYEVVGWIGGGGPLDDPRLRWLGSLGDLRTTIIDEGIDLLVWAPPQGSRTPGIEAICTTIADQCLDLPVRLIGANQLYEETLGHVPVGTIDAAWYGYILHPRFHPAAPISKRILDLGLATALGLVCAPLLALAAAAVRLGDGGPVLYRQTRVGEYGTQFELLKLRTMHFDAEESGPRWSSFDDPRVTPVGRLLRRTHLDELPQLWNVLVGEMTLVGPRPERPEIVAELEAKFPHYARRQLVKPGITGWAALRCGYAGSELGAAWKLCHDLFYIKRRSITVDALILIETTSEIFRGAHPHVQAPRERFLIRGQARG